MSPRGWRDDGRVEQGYCVCAVVLILVVLPPVTRRRQLCSSLLIPPPQSVLAKAAVLHDRQLREHFHLVHLPQTFCDFLESRDGAGDLVKEGRVLVERAALDGVNVHDGGYEEVRWCERFDGRDREDRGGSKGRMAYGYCQQVIDETALSTSPACAGASVRESGKTDSPTSCVAPKRYTRCW